MTKPSGQAIRVLIVDDHSVVRRGMRAYLELLPDIELVGEAQDGEHAMDELLVLDRAGSLPDVVLMDLVMPRLGGVAAISRIRARYSAIAVVAVTSFGENERVQAALEAGASGYLLKDADGEEIAAAVRAAHRGEMHIDAAVTSSLMRPFQPRSPLDTLTPREREILSLVSKGHSNQEIADELHISERTARTHVSNVMTKLGVNSRTQAALWALREGIDRPASA